MISNITLTTIILIAVFAVLATASLFLLIWSGINDNPAIFALGIFLFFIFAMMTTITIGDVSDNLKHPVVTCNIETPPQVDTTLYSDTRNPQAEINLVYTFNPETDQE